MSASQLVEARVISKNALTVELNLARIRGSISLTFGGESKGTFKGLGIEELLIIGSDRIQRGVRDWHAEPRRRYFRDHGVIAHFYTIW